MKRASNKIYLDYAATTPVDKRVLSAMLSYFSDDFGNPGSLHSFGQSAVTAIDSARETIAGILGAEFGDVIFTGSATEANNLALRSAVLDCRRNKTIPNLISTAIEHESVLETLKDIEGRGEASVTILSVGKDGRVSPEALRKALKPETVLVSVMYVNNETGAVQPIAELSRVVKNFNYEILFHTDAVQAFQYLDCNVNELGVDLLTLSAHKIYGPKGVGALFARGRGIAPVITGGGQEFGARSGTENVPSIVGFAKAAEVATGMRDAERDRVFGLRDYFWRKLKKIYPKAEINGVPNSRKSNLKNSGGILKYTTKENKKNLLNLPNILNVYFPGERAGDLLVKFDKAGIAVSAGSACQARSAKPSHVLRALGLPEDRVRASVRFSLGRKTDEKELNEFFERIKTWK